ncbi:uncharacterized protein JCM6883_006504 [Sporobolomyces salmoneus]|uniref:uncharacterized protein n=1 Tax=Sporobolomyces salmoneus TaxID=183962 RepID=UPI00317BFCE4
MITRSKAGSTQLSAIDWANAVLSLPSSSKASTVRPSDLPATPETLANAWCESLKNESTSEETQKLVLRALRVSRLSESHELILETVSPLLLSSSPSIRLQAAGALLQYTSISTSEELERNEVNIIKTIRRTLAPIRLTIHSSPSSTSRFVSTCFRILSTVISKVSPLNSDLIESVVSLLAHWVYHGPSSAGTSSPGPARGRKTTVDSNQLTAGVISAFAQASITPKKRHPAAASSRTASSDREGASGSESEDAKKDNRMESAQIRLDALTCLRSLARNNNKGLQVHWQHFVSDSPYLRNRSTLMTLVESDPILEVRIQACQTLEAMLEGSTAYLSIAQDRPAKASFTSLSTRVGEIVGELHLSLTSLLDKPVGQGSVPLRLAILSLTERLATCSPYGRMKRSLANPLARAVSKELIKEPSVVKASLSALTAIIKRYHSTSSKQHFDWELLDEFSRLSKWTQFEEQVEITFCDYLVAILRARPDREVFTIVSYLSANFATCSPSVQVARIKAITAFLPPMSPFSEAGSQPGRFFGLSFLWPTFRTALKSPHPKTRALACSALSHPSLRSHPDCKPLNWAKHLVDDPENEVASAARRVLGLLLRDSEENSTAAHIEAIEELTSYFMDGKDEDVWWAMANACDELTAQDADKVDIELLHDRCSSVLWSPESTEAVYTSCLRILGSILRINAAEFDPEDSAIAEILDDLTEALDKKSAKLRWNVCTALSTALSAFNPRILATSSFTELFNRIIQLLREDPSYKVRSHAVTTLSNTSAIVEKHQFLKEVDELNLEKVKEAAVDTKKDLEDQIEAGKVQQKERNQVDMLIKKLDTLLTPS